MSATGPGQSTDLLWDVVAVLNAAQIDYAVIGALAASVHGVVRASLDADAVVHASIAELDKVNGQLKALGLNIEVRRGDLDDPIPGIVLISDQYDNRVDLLTGLRGMSTEVYKRAVEVNIPGAEVALRVVCLEDLIAMKSFAGGPQDLLDAKRCIAVAGAELNVELLRKIVACYGNDAHMVCEKLLAERGVANLG